MISTPVHLNGSLLCAIDTSTTGLEPGFHELTKIAIVPLMADWRPDPKLQIFEVRLQPQRTHTFHHPSTKMSYVNICYNIKHGLDPSLAADVFVSWFKGLGIPERKKITPVGFNYKLHDLPFIVDWLGKINYDFHFDWRVRDVLDSITFVNDLYDHRSERIGFPKYALGSVCRRLGVEMPTHDPLSDAVATAECYRKLFDFMPYMGSGLQLQPDDSKDEDDDVRDQPDSEGGDSGGVRLDVPTP